jgi:hypothetical protein
MSLFLKDSRQEPRLEMLPDAWKRFHGAVHMMTKASPQHRLGIEKSKAESGKGRRRRGKKLYRHQ